MPVYISSLLIFFKHLAGLHKTSYEYCATGGHFTCTW